MYLYPGSCVHTIMIHFLLELPSLNCLQYLSSPFIGLDFNWSYEMDFNMWVVIIRHLISPLHVKEFNVKNIFISPDKLECLLLSYFFKKYVANLTHFSFLHWLTGSQIQSKKHLQLLVTITLMVYLSDYYNLGLFFHFFFICLMSSALCP